MTVTVQSDAGDVANANAYVTVAEFKTYHDARGNTYTNDDTLIGAAIIRASMYLDTRFPFLGIKLLTDQTTEWPRKARPFYRNGGYYDSLYWYSIYPYPVSDPTMCGFYFQDANGHNVIGIPVAIKNATMEYALRAMTIPLFQDAPAPEGGQVISEHTVKVDVIEESIKYASGQGPFGNFQMPSFPQADLMLARAGLIQAGRLLHR